VIDIQQVLETSDGLPRRDAIELLERTLRDLVVHGVPGKELAGLYHALAILFVKEGRPDVASEWMEKRLSVSVDGEVVEWLVLQYAGILSESGKFSTAIWRTHASLARARASGGPLGIYLQLGASVLWRCGQRHDATVVAKEWYEYERAAGMGMAGIALLKLVDWQLDAGQLEDARASLEQHERTADPFDGFQIYGLECERRIRHVICSGELFAGSGGVGSSELRELADLMTDGVLLLRVDGVRAIRALGRAMTIATYTKGKHLRSWLAFLALRASYELVPPRMSYVLRFARRAAVDILPQDLRPAWSALGCAYGFVAAAAQASGHGGRAAVLYGHSARAYAAANPDETDAELSGLEL
jgi:hypothetical protein